MTWLAPALRVVGVALVAAAIVDPGCPRPRVPWVVVQESGEAASGGRRQLERLAEWATVVDAADPARRPVGADVFRVVVGDAGAAADAVRVRPADLVLEAERPHLDVTRIEAPTRVTAGMRVPVRVQAESVPSDASVVISLSDAVSGAEEGRGEGRAGADGTTVVTVDWLASGTGRRTLRATASIDGPRVLPGHADVGVEVGPATVDVSMLDARPTWAGRFARLALGQRPGVRLRSEVRTAPQLVVRTDTSPDAGEGDPQVLVVAGVESLTAGDVARLEREVALRGRALVLLLDAAPGPGPWRRLWPLDVGSVRSAPQPVTATVAGHRWRLREWVSGPASTAAVPLAYLDSDDTPVMLARAVGAGRVVLVAGLDAWRWRADEDVAFDLGWEALVARLAADVPPALSLQTWLTGTGADRTAHVDLVPRPDAQAGGDLVVEAVPGDGASPTWTIWAAGPGRWRGAASVATGDTATVHVRARRGATVVAEASAVIDLRAARRPASWDEVVRLQAGRGQLTGAAGEWPAALTSLRARVVPGEGPRWYPTRTWPFAALVLAVLGLEWIVRRLRGAR